MKHSVITALIYALLMFIFLPSIQAGEKNNAVVTINDVPATPGEEVMVPVYAEGLQDIGMLQLRFAYDSDVLHVSNIDNVLHDINPVLMNFILFEVTSQDGPSVQVAYIFLPTISIPDGEKLFDLKFDFCNDLLGCALNETSSEVTIVGDHSFLMDELDFIPMSWNNGSVFADPPLRILTVETEGSGMVEVDGSPYTEPIVVVEGTSLALEATPAEDWVFQGWTGDLSGINPSQSLLMNGHKNITANFIPEGVEEYTITATAGDNGSISPSGEITVEEGDNQTFDILPDNGYHIADVVVDGASVGALTEYTFTNVTDDHTIHATFAINTYTIVTSVSPATGGTVDGAGTYEHGQEVALTASPNAGYEFVNWTENGEVVSSTNAEYIFPATGNRALVANFEEVTYTLTITIVGSGNVSVDGDDYTAPITVEEGTTLNLEAIAADWWDFDAWSGDVPKTGNTLEVTMDDNKNITATFIRQQFTLTIHSSGDGSVQVDGTTYTEEMTINGGETVSLLAVPDEYWQFDGWSGDLGGEKNPTDLLMDENKEITTGFILPEYTLTVTIEGQGEVEVDGVPYTEAIAADAGTLLDLEALPDEGWQFDSWSGDLTGSNASESITLDGNKEVTATFTEIPPEMYTLTIHIIGEGVVEADGATYADPITVEEGTTLDLEVIAADWWDFDGWTGDLESTNASASILMDQDKELTATFTQQEFTLTIIIDGNGSVEVDGTPYTEEMTINGGETISLEALPDQYWQFDGWTGDLGGEENPTDLLMDEDKEVTAHFSQPEYTLTVTIIGEGDVTVGGASYTEQVTVAAGTTLNLEALPAEGWQFDSWSGDLTGSNASASITLDGNKEVTATFTEIPPDMYTLTITIVGSGSVSVDGDDYTAPITVEEGATLNLEAIAADWWDFDAWSGDVPKTGNTLEVTMDDNKNITATFIRQQFTLTIHSNGNGSVQVDGTTYTEEMTIDGGETVSLLAVPDEYWQFDGWSGDLGGEKNPTDLLMDENKEITAGFILPEYTLTVTIEGQGEVEVDGVPYTEAIAADAGTVLDLEAFPDEGWQFDSWSGDLTSSNASESITLDGNKEVTTTFTEIPPEMYTLTINIIGEGVVKVDGATYAGPITVEEGTTLELEAIAADWWDFDGWTDDLESTNASASILMDQDKELTATFSQEQFTLTIHSSGNGSVQVEGATYTGEMTIGGGETISLEALPDQYWQFDGWSGDLGGEENPTDLLMDENKEITAGFILPEYTLTVTIEGQGEVEVDGAPYTEAITADAGTVLDLEAFPDEGWQFDSWSGDLTSSNASESISLDGNKEVTTTFTEIPPEMYTLTINIIGEGVVEVDGATYAGPITVEEGTTLELEAIAADWWDFDGWTDDLESTDATETILMDQDKELTATFSQEQFTLTIHTEGDGSVAVDGAPYTGEITIGGGETISLEALPDEYWQFDGWSGDLGGEENPADLLMDQDKEVTATFSQPDYTLTLHIVGEGDVTVDGTTYTEPVTVAAGTLLDLEALPMADWHFYGWSGDLGGSNNPIDLLMDRNKEITTTFRETPIDHYILRVNFSGEGKVLIDGSTYESTLSIEEGTEINLEAIAEEWWDFAAWTGDLESTNVSETILMDDDKDVTANFVQEEFTLLINTVGDGTVKVDGASYVEQMQINGGKTVSLLAEPDDLWQFDSWSGDLEGTGNPTNLMIDADKVVTASFAEIPPDEYTLTVHVDGEGIVEVDGASYASPLTYDEGTTVTLEAIAATDWEFVGWTGDLTGDIIVKDLVMDADKEVTATFTEIPPDEYTLTIEIDGQGIVEVDGASYASPLTYDEGTTVTLEVIAATDWEFVGWSGDADHLAEPDSLNTALIIPSLDIEIIAHFEEDDATSVDPDLEPKQQFHLYPNPTDGLVMLEADQAVVVRPAKVKLHNIRGELILVKKWDVRQPQVIDLSDYQPGLYLLKITTPAGNSIQRIIKQ